MDIRLSKGTWRNTQAHVLGLNNHTLYFSYETCIAYSGPEGHFRLDNHWGPTTGRHINEMGLRTWPIATNDVMDNALKQI